jgi:site-specific DNA-adenine methylase
VLIISNNDFLPSFIGGFGGKGEACRIINFQNYLPVEKFSDSKCIYIEPFTFTGVVFFNIPCKSAILNDKNENVFNLWNVLEKNHNEFVKELEFVFVGPSWFNQFRERTDPIGKAIFYYMCNHLEWEGDTGTLERIWYHGKKNWIISHFINSLTWISMIFMEC